MPKKDDEFAARMKDLFGIHIFEYENAPGELYAVDYSMRGEMRKSPRAAVHSLVREMEKRVREIKEAMGDE